MPDNYSRELKEILRQHGCHPVRQSKGDHERWHSPITGINFTVDNAIKSRHTANGTLKQAGIKKHF